MQINPSEVLRYLGYRGKPADQAVRNTIASCSEELLREAAPRQIYRRVALRTGYLLLGLPYTAGIWLRISPAVGKPICLPPRWGPG